MSDFLSVATPVCDFLCEELGQYSKEQQNDPFDWKLNSRKGRMLLCWCSSTSIPSERFSPWALHLMELGFMATSDERMYNLGLRFETS